MKKVAFHTLGCKVNQYETEAMAGSFRKSGYEVVDERDYADVYVINTCTVTAVADKKSRQYIRRMKKVNPDSIIAVTGCYVQISPREVSAIKGVDFVVGINEKNRIVELIEEHEKGRCFISDPDSFTEMGPVVSAENRTRAYIKVQEGCNRFCTYCVIPYARGPVRSRPLENIVEEAEKLIEAGFKELVLTGINTAQYGMEGIDLYSQAMPEESFGIEKVISSISELPGDFRIRLSSLEPAVVNSEYVKRLFKYDKLCHHLHMSAQSGSDSVLSAMNRPYNLEGYYNLVNTLFDFDPCYGVSTDIIVGFPGEKSRDFDDSCELVSECSFCKTHIFKYSKRPFTEAAQMKGQVSPQIKKERAEKLEAVARKAAEDFFAINLAEGAEGRSEKVLTEEIFTAPDGSKFITGYTGNYIRAYIPYSDTLKTNDFVKVRLTEIFRDGMKAEIVV